MTNENEEEEQEEEFSLPPYIDCTLRTKAKILLQEVEGTKAGEAYDHLPIVQQACGPWLIDGNGRRREGEAGDAAWVSVICLLRWLLKE